MAPLVQSNGILIAVGVKKDGGFIIAGYRNESLVIKRKVCILHLIVGWGSSTSISFDWSTYSI